MDSKSSKRKPHDFRPMGKAIKDARIEQGLTRDQTAEEVGISPDYLVLIENKGQTPHFDVVVDLTNLFHISIDEFFSNDPSMSQASKPTTRRQIDAILDVLSEEDLFVIKTVSAALKTRKANNTIK